jgi:hypothetical protein
LETNLGDQWAKPFGLWERKCPCSPVNNATP